METLNLIHEEINSGEYECLICLNSITPRSQVWSCRSCYRVYDLKCIKDWGNRTVEKRGTWSCPHCLTLQTQKIQSLHYRCWCGKQKRSNSNRRLDAPHSCGQTCGAKRSCPHPCPLTCHAGPHANSADCLYMGPRMTCFCGKNTEQVICSMTHYDGIACGQKCLKTNRICKHKCQRQCHSGTCDHCEIQVKVNCFCGEVSDKIELCGSLSRNQRSKLRSSSKLTISCGKICNETLDCGKHSCKARCHSHKAKPHICPAKPFRGETCFCGKNEISRTSCEEPRTSCGDVCAKLMKCGHSCQESCHDGPCPPCAILVPDIPCKCGATRHTIPCGSRNTPPSCEKKCDAYLSCKRHMCRRECCEFRPRNSGAQKSHTKRRDVSLGDLLSGALHIEPQSPPTTSEAEQAAHLCPRICGRLLACGSHTCPMLCHTGKCRPCLSTSFDEYTCPCGRTTLDPPIRCGTPLPLCHARCHRAQECGHEPQHSCHFDGEPCAPCSVMVDVSCRCGKSTVKEKCHAVRNGSMNPKFCTTECSEILPCGHRCRQKCCPGAGHCPPCRSRCDHRYACGHLHDHECHYSRPCPEACDKILISKCPCGISKCEYECGEDMEIGCTDTCIVETYPEVLLDAYEHEKRWLLHIEYQIRDFLKQKVSKTLWFKPMNKRHRRYVYYMLEHYGLEGESVDFGENRSIRAKYTNKAHLCRILLQHASKVEPLVYIDQIMNDVEHLEPLEGDVTTLSNDLEQHLTDDGFVEIVNRNSSIDNASSQEIDDERPKITTPSNQYLLLP